MNSKIAQKKNISNENELILINDKRDQILNKPIRVKIEYDDKSQQTHSSDDKEQPRSSNEEEIQEEQPRSSNEEEIQEEQPRSSNEGESESSGQCDKPDNDLEFLELENDFDNSNDQIQDCKTKQAEMLENQDQNALEDLIQEYGIDNVCFDCITGFKNKKAYAQHMKHEHAEEAYEQGLGKFLCKYCNTLLFTKRNLLTHLLKQHKKNMKKKQLSVRQQKIVNSFSTQSEKKSQVLRKFIEKKKKK